MFSNITDLNWQALDWCNYQNNLYHRATASVPQQVHMTNCVVQLHELPKTDAIRFYLCPERKISFDGFVNYEDVDSVFCTVIPAKQQGFSTTATPCIFTQLICVFCWLRITLHGAVRTASAKDNTRILLNRRSSLRCRSRHKFSGFPSRKAIFPLPSLTLTRRIRYE